MARNIRDVSPFLQKVRNFLAGRESTLGVRFTDAIATRSPPLPELPVGPSHRLHQNYYFARDGRREVAPPQAITPGQQLLAEGAAPTKVSCRTPGKLYNWD